MVAYGAVSVYHLDCFSGLSGDMFLAACIDLGFPLERLRESIELLGLRSARVESREERRAGLRGTRFLVEIGREGEKAEAADTEASVELSAVHQSGARDFAAIKRMILSSSLEPTVGERALRLFARLAEAESRVHGVSVDRVHFHEVGAVDSIVDLLGAAVAWEWLQPQRLTCGPVNVGGGIARSAHGALPVPAPATAELLRGIPVYSEAEGELLTPTGAVLLAELVDEFTLGPELIPEAVGYGAGSRDLPGRANVVRLWRGHLEEGEGGAGPRVAVIEAEVDDTSAEALGFAMERLFAAGALDVYFTPVQMKKNRPGTLLTAICRPDQVERAAGVLMTETGSLGCRWYPANRFEAEREIQAVETPFGLVQVKCGCFAGRTLAAAPEFEDCRRLALEHDVAWREVYRAALEAAGLRRD
ncbi:MAG TPA: nickel pincer cofactor biosynthesis protein LarC [Thermoanaerobaculia bacterium]|nr:nickel pincer cofactor biosynthesis protein LarC [Thermoanaerobaculia bacterium]